MGRKQKSTAITNKTTPEQNKAITILIDQLKNLEKLKINKIKEEYLHSGFKGFITKKISKSMIPKGKTWAWNQSNARIIYPLSPSVTVTLFKLNPRRLTPSDHHYNHYNSNKSSDQKKKSKKIKKEEYDDDDDEDYSHNSANKKMKINKYNNNDQLTDEEDDDIKPSYKLWIYQLNLSNHGNLDQNANANDQNKAKKKKSNQKTNGKNSSKNNSNHLNSHYNNNQLNATLSTLIENYHNDHHPHLNNASNNDNFLISFLWCEKGRSAPIELSQSSPENNSKSYFSNKNENKNDSKIMKNNINNENANNENNNQSLINNIHLNNLNSFNNLNNNNNNSLNKGSIGGASSSFAVPYLHHIHQKMNINYNTPNSNNVLDDDFDYYFQNANNNLPHNFNNFNSNLMNNSSMEEDYNQYINFNYNYNNNNPIYFPYKSHGQNYHSNYINKNYYFDHHSDQYDHHHFANQIKNIDHLYHITSDNNNNNNNNVPLDDLFLETLIN